MDDHQVQFLVRLGYEVSPVSDGTFLLLKVFDSNLVWEGKKLAGPAAFLLGGGFADEDAAWRTAYNHQCRIVNQQITCHKS